MKTTLLEDAEGITFVLETMFIKKKLSPKKHCELVKSVHVILQAGAIKALKPLLGGKISDLILPYL